ncbi:hypothetical protein DICSQDRAFT_170187 [Dichomitus squalens LYAD-421 SS1]|uniref:Uncharacterized protein n=1 Tax=Dichomitus squalens (strain LYAD-421) TaxID=732165 RepID=R7T0C1_DICSQ|nr:uncharacterized protein DICSQDRAFT_170187 [Dichomitus squalens LYAD-421 SS1]EJF61435.1 hypothetical protein DICSQDRAFT_170187 [Dichomitus squalens LYAD-421 SS1]
MADDGFVDRLKVVTAFYKDTQTSRYCPTVRQLCQIDASNRLPPAPTKCPRCSFTYGNFEACLTYKDEHPGKWFLRCVKCKRMHMPSQSGPSPWIAKAIEAQLEANAMAAAEDTLVAREQDELRQAILISKREAEQQQKEARAQAKVAQRLRQADAKVLASVDRLRQDARKAHEQDVVARRTGSQPKKGKRPVAAAAIELAPVRLKQLVKLILWLKPDDAPVAHDVEIDAIDHLYLLEIDLLGSMWDGIEIQAKFWCPETNAWCPGMEAMAVSSHTRIILVRHDFIGRCLNLGTELHVAQTCWSGSPGRGSLTAMRAERKSILGRKIKADQVWVVLWYKDHEEPVKEHAHKLSDQFLLRYSPTIFELIRKGGSVDLWHDDVSDWERIRVREQIPISAATHTLLLRVPGVEGMPSLGLEIEALSIPRQSISPIAQKTPERGRKRDWDDVVAECNRSRSSSLEPLQVGPGVKMGEATTEKGDAGDGARGRAPRLAGGAHAVFGQSAPKRVKVEEAEVDAKPKAPLNWVAAETTVGGVTTIDLDLLYD